MEGECPTESDSPEISMCGDTQKLNTEGGAASFKYYATGEIRLSELGCEEGLKTVTLKDDSGYTSIGEIDILNTASGKYLNVNLNSYDGCLSRGNPDLRQFHFTDNNKHKGDKGIGEFDAPASGGYILVNEDGEGNCDSQLTDAWGSYEVEEGTIIEQSPEFSLSDAVSGSLSDACGSSCNDRTDWVMNQDFHNGRFNDKCNSEDECFISREENGDNSYMPRGDIIVGNAVPPEYEKNLLRGSLDDKFFLCDPDTPSTEEQLVYAGGETYQCQFEKASRYPPYTTYEDPHWEEVAECNDGKDNDWDGSIDYKGDPNCDSKYDDNEGSPPPACNPKVRYDGNGEITALYQGDWNGNDCGYTTEAFTWDEEDKQPELFTCNLELPGGMERYTRGSDKRTFCTETDNFYGGDDHPEQFKAVKYYATKEYIISESGESEFYLQEGDTWRSDFVDRDNGFKGQFQTIHDAEQKYDPPMPREMRRISGVDRDTWLHSTSAWTQKGLVDLDDGYNKSEYDDSWIVSNAGHEHSGVGSSEFEGGFAGKCSTGQRWTYIQRQNKWTCSGDLPWEQTVFFPEISVHDESGKEKAGFFLMPSNFDSSNIKNPKRSFSQVWQNAHGEDMHLSKIHAVCWDGDTDDEPNYGEVSDDKYFTVEADLPRDVDHPVAIYGEMDWVQDGESSSNYACEWYYELSNGELIGHKDTSPGLGNLNKLKAADQQVREFDSLKSTVYADNFEENFEGWSPSSLSNGALTSYLAD